MSSSDFQTIKAVERLQYVITNDTWGWFVWYVLLNNIDMNRPHKHSIHGSMTRGGEKISGGNSKTN